MNRNSAQMFWLTSSSRRPCPKFLGTPVAVFQREAADLFQIPFRGALQAQQTLIAFETDGRCGRTIRVLL